MEREHGQLWNTMAGIARSIQCGDTIGNRTASAHLLIPLDTRNAIAGKSLARIRLA